MRSNLKLLNLDRITTESHVRRGLSLVLVFVAISMSLVLTYATLSSQSRSLQIHQNVDRQELARRAAESGAAIALAKIQASDWSGVSTKLNSILETDSAGTSSYSVEFLTIDGQTSPSAYPMGGGQTSLNTSGGNILNMESPGLSLASAAKAATATRNSFRLLIRSTGTWQSATSTTDTVTEVIDVGTELQPRVVGRPILAGDSASASDVLPSNAGYDSIQQFALFTSMGSSSSESLHTEPGHRIDGPSWIYRGIQIFDGPGWNSTPRNQFLQDIGNQHASIEGTQTLLQYPHPYGGPITFCNSPTASEAADLDRLKVPYQQATQFPVVPTVAYSNWQSYQLFQGGFTYDAEVLTSNSLEDVVLCPTPRNPLGVFYRSGNLTVHDDVVVQGTLVCTGTLKFSSTNVAMSSVKWSDESGAELTSNSRCFPRAPAIVTRDLVFDRNTRVMIEGAVLVTNNLKGSDGDFELSNSPPLDVSGSQATAYQIRQPYSLVQLPESFDMSGIAGGGGYEVWLQEGISGDWFPIVSVDSAKRQLVVLGEAVRVQTVDFRIRQQRQRFCDIRGPVMTDRLQMTVSNAWKLKSNLWNSRYSLWQMLIDLQQQAGVIPTTWASYVADPTNYPNWGAPHETVGLPLDPTVHFKPLAGLKYRDGLPLFKGYVALPSGGAPATSELSGYRWRVLSWQAK